MEQKELKKYKEECVRISKGEITRLWDVARMNSKNFPDGSYKHAFVTKKEALDWIDKNGWKLWGYWENKI